MCRITINAQGVEVTDSVRRLIEGDLGAVLEPHGVRVAFAHVRLWEGVGGPTTCYIRVDLNPSGGLGLGVMAGAMTLSHDGTEALYTVVGVGILALGHRLNAIAAE